MYLDLAFFRSVNFDILRLGQKCSWWLREGMSAKIIIMQTAEDRV